MSKGLERRLELLKNRALSDLDSIPTTAISICEKSNEEVMEAYETIKQALQRLEAIENANHSEALNDLKLLHELAYGVNGWKIDEIVQSSYIKQTLIKSQEQEKENELLKEIIRSLFDRGCPLHQYTDKDFGLTIEVDNECSTMILGEFKGVDLDKKLKEVLEE